MKQLLYNSLFSHILRCFSDIYFICSFLFCKLIRFLKVSVCSLMLFAEKFFSYTCIVLMRTFITPLLCDTCCSLCRRKRSLTSLYRPVPSHPQACVRPQNKLRKQIQDGVYLSCYTEPEPPVSHYRAKEYWRVGTSIQTKTSLMFGLTENMVELFLVFNISLNFKLTFFLSNFNYILIFYLFYSISIRFLNLFFIHFYSNHFYFFWFYSILYYSILFDCYYFHLFPFYFIPLSSNQLYFIL